MKARIRHRLQTVCIVLLLCMSLSSYLYINNVELNPTPTESVRTIYAEDLEETEKGIMPDLHLFKQMMRKTVEFMTLSPPVF